MRRGDMRPVGPELHSDRRPAGSWAEDAVARRTCTADGDRRSLNNQPRRPCRQDDSDVWNEEGRCTKCIELQ